MFTKVLIANRGAIARRVIQTCNDLKLHSVAVYSEADASAPYLNEASEAIALPGNSARQTYLNQQLLLDTIRSVGADAVHPGYGFLAEHAGFAEAVIATGASFIGPDPKWIRLMGDKVAAREVAQQHGLEIFAGSGLVEDLDAAQQAAERIGYPLMIKPSAGGGGIGMRQVRNYAELESAYLQTRELAERSFSNSDVFLERYLKDPRHIEFQLLGDHHGDCRHAYERDCSIQRRHQKLIEETPAPGLDAAAVLGMAERAAEFAGGLGYDNVGTLETLRSVEGQYGFLEMNTRIQVEHGVTEAVTGLDLVAWQIYLAAGRKVQQVPAREGFAIELRLYAEHPRTQLPSTGRLSVYKPPQLFGVRIDTGYQQGQWITPFYDPLLAKVIAHGMTREQAIGRALIALKAFEVQGVETNASLLIGILQDAEFLAGKIDTGFLPRYLARTTN